MVDRGFHFGGPRFFLKILVDRGLVDRGSEKLSTTLATTFLVRCPSALRGYGSHRSLRPRPLGSGSHPILGRGLRPMLTGAIESTAAVLRYARLALE